MRFKDSSKLSVPTDLVNKIIGQAKAVSLIRKASKQRRHILLIGDPELENRCSGKHYRI